MVWLNINPRSPLPVYQQIVRGIKEAVVRGYVKPGQRLPTVRELAAEFGVNHNTVAKSYQELERDGVIETLRSKGTYISEVQPVVPDRLKRLERVRELMQALMVEAHYAQITPEEIIHMFTNEVDAWMIERGRT